MNNYNPSREKVILWSLLAIFAIATISSTLSYFIIKDKYDDLSYRLKNSDSLHNSEISKYETKIIDLINDTDSLKSRIQEIGKKVPFIVTDIKMGNMYKDCTIHTDYGSPIYSSSSMFLSPKIYYDGIKSGSYTIYWKIFYPDGRLSTGETSPSGYSTSGTIYINEGDGKSYSMKGWGNENKGFWRSGTYRIEIWYNNNSCLKSETFTIL